MPNLALDFSVVFCGAWAWTPVTEHPELGQSWCLSHLLVLGPWAWGLHSLRISSEATTLDHASLQLSPPVDGVPGFHCASPLV